MPYGESYGENLVMDSDIVYTIHGNKVIKGSSSSYGDIIATTEGGVMSGAAALFLL